MTCDLETGSCGHTDTADTIEIITPQTTRTKVQIMYFTDPICSACWAIEPEIKRFKRDFGSYVDVNVRMGGLLPGWKGFSDGGNGINKPSDVAGHWDEVGRASGMSIDGDIWLEDPLESSYPASIAFKAVEIAEPRASGRFLRILREMVFLEKKNIARKENLELAMGRAGADVGEVNLLIENGTAEKAFEADLEEGRRLGVRGFPAFIAFGADGTGYRASGIYSSDQLRDLFYKALGKAVEPEGKAVDIKELLSRQELTATREISRLSDLSEEETRSQLMGLTSAGFAEHVSHKYGDFWRLK